MPDIIPAPADYQDPSVIVGSDAEIFIDSTKVGFLLDLSGDLNYNISPINAIGHWFPRGSKSLTFQGTLNGQFHLLSQGEEGAPPLPQGSEILTARPNLIECRETSTGRRIARALVKLNTESFNISANQLSGRRVSFFVIRIGFYEGYN